MEELISLKANKPIEQDPICLTPSALDRLRVLKSKEENQNVRLRITVNAGGCSGFQYKFDFDDTVEDDDIIFAYEDTEIITDEVSFDLISGIVVDYVSSLIGASFSLRNPNASVSCGCGNSFSI